MKLYLDRSPLQAVNIYYGKYLVPIQWEDEYDEDLPVQTLSFTVTTLSGMIPGQESVLKIDWNDAVPKNQTIIEAEIRNQFNR